MKSPLELARMQNVWAQVVSTRPHARALRSLPATGLGRLQRLNRAGRGDMVRAMNRQEYEQLDIHQMERMVAEALIDLIDDPQQQHRITLKLLAQRTRLPLRRVREVTDAWNLQALSGDELWLGPGSVEAARALCKR